MKKIFLIAATLLSLNSNALEVFNATHVSSIISGCVAISGCKLAEDNSREVLADLEEYTLSGNLSILLQQKISDLQKVEDISAEEALELIIKNAEAESKLN